MFYCQEKKLQSCYKRVIITYSANITALSASINGLLQNKTTFWYSLGDLA